MIKTLADRVRITLEDGIAEVALIRPDKMNALDADTFDAICEASELLAALPELRAVIFYGEGPAFCAGLDVSLMSQPEAIGDLTERSHGICNRYQQAAWGWHQLPVPVLAAISGPCIGGGLQIALGADLRIVHPEATFCVMEIQWGLIPDMGFTQLAPKLMREDVVRDLMFSGRKITGSEAQNLGLATSLAVDPLAEARVYARELANKSPDAIRAAKRLVNSSSDDIAKGLMAESQAMASLFNSANQREAVMARLQKRPPEFSDPK